MDLPKCLSISLLTPEGPAALPFGRLLITNCQSSRVGGDIRVEYHSSLIPLRGVYWRAQREFNCLGWWRPPTTV